MKSLIRVKNSFKIHKLTTNLNPDTKKENHNKKYNTLISGNGSSLYYMTEYKLSLQNDVNDDNRFIMENNLNQTINSQFIVKYDSNLTLDCVFFNESKTELLLDNNKISFVVFIVSALIVTLFFFYPDPLIDLVDILFS